jgi:hypothetical protein
LFHHLTPDVPADGAAPHVISDEPTPNIPQPPDYPGLVRTFHDVVMCADTTVLEALTWTWCVNRNGVHAPRHRILG